MGRSDFPIQIDDVQRLVVEPGDQLVVKLTGRASAEQLEQVALALRERFPNNRCLVLDETASLEVIRGA